MSRDQILASLESYWHGVQAECPDEVLDIPDAMCYYNTLSDSQLLREYNEKIG